MKNIKSNYFRIMLKNRSVVELETTASKEVVAKAIDFLESIEECGVYRLSELLESYGFISVVSETLTVDFSLGGSR